MSEYKPSDDLKKFVDDYLGGCPKCKQQAEQIERMTEVLIKAHDTMLTVSPKCECDREKLFNIRSKIKIALAAPPQGGE